MKYDQDEDFIFENQPLTEKIKSHTQDILMVLLIAVAAFMAYQNKKRDKEAKVETETVTKMPVNVLVKNLQHVR